MSASRSYEGLADLRPILAFASEATRARSPLFTSWHPGDVVWELKTAADSPQPVQAWPGESGLEAMAWFVGDGEVWLEALPSAEHRVAEAVGWAEARMRAQHPGAPPELRIRAYETDKRRIGALEALGYVRGGPDGVVFRMSLDGALPEPPNPDGLTLRDSEGVDPALRAAAHRAAWSHLEHLGIHGESQFTTETYLALRGLPVYRPSLDILAVSPGGEFVGGCIAWADPVSGVGVFEPVGTALAWRGRRVAALVMAEALRRLKALGMREARVGTAHFNHAAIAAYRAAGFETADRTFWWEKAL